MLTPLRTLLLLIAGSLPLTAQSTWIVDADARPGSQFTTIDAAIAAAGVGDTILVQRASIPYPTFTVDKGLRILGVGEPEIWNFRFNPSVTIQNLPAGQSLTLDGFAAPTEQAFEVVVQNCAGRVVLSRLRAIDPCQCGPGILMPAGFAITDCAQVAVDRCETFGKPAIACLRSTVTISGSLLGMTSAGATIGSCLSIDASTVWVWDSQLDGSLMMDIQGLAQPAVVVHSGSLTVGATTNSFVQGSVVSGAAYWQPAIDVIGGTVVLDPEVRLNPHSGNPLNVRSGATLVTRQTSCAVVHGATLGGLLDAELLTTANAPALLLLGLPIPPVSLSGVGTVWLDPSASILLGVGVSPGGSLRVAMPLPAVLPRGLEVCVQGAADLGAGPEMSGASLVVLR
ncbi:MAG: hypothetical protein AB7I19_01820 [Planctomycetota bacterium]